MIGKWRNLLLLSTLLLSSTVGCNINISDSSNGTDLNGTSEISETSETSEATEIFTTTLSSAIEGGETVSASDLIGQILYSVTEDNYTAAVNAWEFNSNSLVSHIVPLSNFTSFDELISSESKELIKSN